MVEAICTLSNDKGEKIVHTPGAVLVNRSDKKLSITCARHGVNQNIDLYSSSNLNMATNIIVGGFIGIAVDMQSGAGYDYPKEINIALKCGNP